MGCKVEAQHVTELIPAYALGCLDEDEAEQVERHLAVCDSCRAEAESYRLVSEQIALAGPLVTPPAELRTRLMARIAPAPDPEPVPRPSPGPSLWQQLVTFTQQIAPVWTPVSLLLIAGLLIANVALWRAQSAVAPGLTSVEMTGTDQAPTARGVLSVAGDAGVLVVSNLPPLDASQQYQLWLIQDGQRIDGGVFSVDPWGCGQLQIAAPQPILDYSAFGITVEPAGGSPGPTGAKVLGS